MAYLLSMIKWLKIITSTFVISIFAVQSVLACACELDIPKNNAHDHHQMMTHDMAGMTDHGKNTDHDCAGSCHMAFNERDGTDLMLLAPEKPKQEKIKYAVSHYSLINDFRKFDRGPPSVQIVQSKFSQFLNTTLFAQGVLLRI